MSFPELVQANAQRNIPTHPIRQDSGSTQDKLFQMTRNTVQSHVNKSKRVTIILFDVSLCTLFEPKEKGIHNYK